ncbi:MAG: AAA-associated domain-containing protein [Deltaproteobacteria bacterium]|nr:AAA-associated domain-containing protein [Deltaproteobacteria bacterium]
MAEPGRLLELRNIAQAYGAGERRFLALEDVNLTIWEGEFVALLGPSGCGKSTLLRLIAGLQEPAEGRILYRGERQVGVNPRATIVFQTFALFPWLTVQENVEVALRARGVPARLRTARALDLLDRVGLDGFETAYPRELSGGMRQKVGFARAMAVEPELLCLDEPFSTLDVLSAEALRGELLELWMRGNIPMRAILMVTHSIEEAVFMADRIVVMGKAPGHVVVDVNVELPHPRHYKAPPFLAVVDRVYSILAGQTRPEPAEPGKDGEHPMRTGRLPDIAVGDLAGLLERLDAMPSDRADLYRLAEELKVESDDLLPVCEGAELLGLATIAHGDITLTALGETFAEASILARKEIFATRIRRLHIFRWLVETLQAAEKKQLQWDEAEAALGEEFPPEQARRQLEIAIDWGRYAELLAYDDSEETLYLELGGSR